MAKILFLCTGNSGRSQMAKAFAEKIAPANLEIVSASDGHHPIHSVAKIVAREAGIILPSQVTDTLSTVSTMQFDTVITLCNKAQEICPTLPGAPAMIHWGLPDPSEDKDNIFNAFIAVRDEIRARVDTFFEHGYFQAILQMHQSFGAILDNLTDGVMAHDLSRRIFFFNNAAERITGYSYADVIGRDCHEVFHGKFCGGNCSFCETGDQIRSKIRYPLPIVRKNGAKREVEMSVVPLRTVRNEVEGAMVVFRDMTEANKYKRVVEGDKGFYGIIGQAPMMKKVFETIRDLADIDVPVLIQGESGTGKEMVAYALHELSSRKNEKFLPINCGALPEGILESELFGHVKGAFTGAFRDKKGLFELADKGTLFLDEIGDVSPAMQVKLLRVLQEKTFVRVGGEKPIKVKTRVISATNKNLKELTQKNEFREDLYYRLAVIPIYMPALRERTSDIPMLVEHFLEKLAPETRKYDAQVSDETMSALIRYPWPGNIRELRNAVQFALIQCKGNILSIEHLPREIVRHKRLMDRSGPGRKPKLNPEQVRQALAQAGDNKAKAARILGVSRTTLYRYMQKVSL